MLSWLLPENWSDPFVLTVPLAEAVLRGVLVYLGLVALLRVLPRREAGSISLTDLLIANLVVEAVSNGLQGESRSVPSALVSAATVLLCSFAVDWLSYRSAWCRKLFQAEPAPLVRDGRIDHASLARQMVTREELESQARLSGLEGLADIKHATMEAEGQISIVPHEGRGAPANGRPPGDALERLWALQRELAQQQARVEAALQELMLRPKEQARH